MIIEMETELKNYGIRVQKPLVCEPCRERFDDVVKTRVFFL